MSKKHDYSMIDHAIRAAVEAGSNNFTAILTDRMVCLEIDAIHEREMAEWSRKSAMVYQGFPPHRNQILDRRLQALRKARAIVYTNAGGWKVAEKPAEEIPPSRPDPAERPSMDTGKLGRLRSGISNEPTQPNPRFFHRL